MKALVLTPATSSVDLCDVAMPVPGLNEVVIRVHSVALNPVDELYANHPIAVQDRRIIGTDFAGIVVSASGDLSGVDDQRVKEGARVAGFLQGASSVNDRPGAFAEYITAPYDLLWLVPADMSLDSASAISMCGLTAAQAVFTRLGLPAPFHGVSKSPSQNNKSQPVFVFVYGASTSLGLYIAQLVRLSALASGQDIRLIGAASESKHNLLSQSSYAYESLVDYRDKNWEKLVLDATGGRGVDYALDCISEGETVTRVHSTLGADAKFAVFRGPVGGQYETKGLRVSPQYGAVWEGLGVEVKYNGVVLPANPEARQFAVSFFDYLSSTQGPTRPRLEPNPIRKMPGGLSRIVPDGFALLGSGLVTTRTNVKRTEEYMRPISAEKLVYTIV